VSDLPERIEESICKRGLLRRGQSLLIAVSGGVDSMVLLHILRELARKYSWRLTVAHLNHCLRGRSSNADERLVIRVAHGLRARVVVERADVKTVAVKEKISIEMAARKVRHDFLSRTASRLKIQTIALAHHADDQLELFFLRLFRGSGSEALAGMKWQNASPANARIKLIRPLLEQPKSELLKFASENEIPFREDASNASLDFQRNRIRHKLLPLLRRHYQPALDRTILRVMDIVGAESEFIRQTAKQVLADERTSRFAFNEQPIAIQRCLIQLQLQRGKIAPDFELIESLRTRAGHLIKVSPHLAVIREADGRLGFQEAKPVASPHGAVRKLDLHTKRDEVVFSDVKFNWQLVPRKGRLPVQRAGGELFDADKVGSRIVLRHWRAGDRFQPSGMKSPVKLQDLFTNRKIPRAERQSLIIAEMANGEIFWVEQLRIAERFKLSAQSNRCLQWRWKRF
jgi:tRNA(Ile)-lysidine synthase